MARHDITGADKLPANKYQTFLTKSVLNLGMSATITHKSLSGPRTLNQTKYGHIRTAIFTDPVPREFLAFVFEHEIVVFEFF